MKYSSEVLREHLIKERDSGAPMAILTAQAALFAASRFLRQTIFNSKHDAEGIKTVVLYHIATLLLPHSKLLSRLNFLRRTENQDESMVKELEMFEEDIENQDDADELKEHVDEKDDDDESMVKELEMFEEDIGNQDDADELKEHVDEKADDESMGKELEMPKEKIEEDFIENSLSHPVGLTTDAVKLRHKQSQVMPSSLNDQTEMDAPNKQVVFKIPLHCEGCVQKIRRVVLKIEGVQSMAVDTDNDLVTVNGTMELMNVDELQMHLDHKLKRKVEVVADYKKMG